MNREMYLKDEKYIKVVDPNYQKDRQNKLKGKGWKDRKIGGGA